MRSCKVPGRLDDQTRAKSTPRRPNRDRLRPSRARGVPLRPTLFLLGVSLLVMLGVAGLADAEAWTAHETDFIHPLGGPLNQGSVPCIGAFPGPGSPDVARVAMKWEYDMTPDDPDEVGYQPLAPYVADIDADGVPEVVFGANYAVINPDNLLDSTVNSKLVILNGTTGLLDGEPWQAGDGKIMFSSPAIGELEHANAQNKAELALFVGDLLGLFKTGSSMKFFHDDYSSPAKSYSLDSPLGDADNATKSEVVILPPYIAESDDGAGDEVVLLLILTNIELGPTFNTEYAEIAHRLYGLQWPSHAENPGIAWRHDATNMSVSLPALADIDADERVEVVYGVGFPPTPDSTTNGTVSDESAKGRDVVVFQPADGASDWTWRSPGIPATIPVLLGPHPDGEYSSVVTWIEDRDDNAQPWHSTNVTLLPARNPPANPRTVEIEGLLGVPPLVVHTTDNATPPNPVDLLVFIIEDEETRMGPSSAIPSQRIVALDAKTLEEKWNVTPPGADVHAGFPRGLIADLDNDSRPNLALLENGTDDGREQLAHLVVYDLFEDGLQELWRVPVDLDMPSGLAIADVDGDDDGRCEIVVSAGAGKPTEGSYNTGGMGHGVVKVFEPDLPDLVVSSVRADNANVVQFDANGVNFTLRNVGRTAPAQGGACIRLVSATGTSDHWIAFPGGTLAAGAQWATAISWTPTQAGSQTVKVAVDPNDAGPACTDADGYAPVTEMNEVGQSASASIVVRWRDVVATSAGLQDAPHPEVGQALTIAASVRNPGDASIPASQPFAVEFRVDGATVASATLTGLAAGQTKTLTAPWTPDSAGAHTLLLEADAGLAVTERYEDNNAISANVEVFEPEPGPPAGVTQILDDFEGPLAWTSYKSGGSSFQDGAASGASTAVYRSPSTSGHAKFWDGNFDGSDAGNVGLRRDFDAAQVDRLDVRFYVDTYSHNGNGYDSLRSGVRLQLLDAEGNLRSSYEYWVSAWEGNLNNATPGPNQKAIYGQPTLDQWIRLKRDPSQDWNIDWEGTTSIRVELFVDGGGTHSDSYRIYYDDLELWLCTGVPCPVDELASGVDEVEGPLQWTAFTDGGTSFLDGASAATSNAVAHSPTTSLSLQFSGGNADGSDSGHVGFRREYDASRLDRLDGRFYVNRYSHDGNLYDSLRSGLRVVLLDDVGATVDTYEYWVSAWEGGDDDATPGSHQMSLYGRPPTDQWVHVSRVLGDDWPDLDWSGVASLRIEAFADAGGTRGDSYRIYFDDFDFAFCANQPCPPGRFAAETGRTAGEIALSWGDSADVGGHPLAGFRLRAADSTDGPWSLRAELPPGARSYRDMGLEEGATRYYRISATNADGEGDASATKNARTLAPPSAPHDLVVTRGPGRGELSLAWQAPSDAGNPALTGYQILRGASPGALGLHRELGNVLSSRDAGLGDNETWHYAVIAVNDYAPSEPSNEAGGTTPALPSAPRSLTATAGPNPAMITLRWDPPTDRGGVDVTTYRIYRGTAPGQETFLRDVAADSQTARQQYTDGNPFDWNDADDALMPGQAYYYKVAAIQVVGEGPPSNEADAVAPPSEPLADPGDAAEAEPAPSTPPNINLR